MKTQLTRQHSHPLLTCMLFAVTLIALLTSLSHAHSPILLIEDNEDGTILVLAGFSNGQMAAGKQVQLKARASGEVVWEGTLDQNGELTCPKQTEPYTVCFDGGPGHTIEKSGPLPQEGETVPAQAGHPAQSAYDTTTGATLSVSSEGTPVIPPDRSFPFSADFDEQVNRLLPDEPLLLKNANGVIQVTRIREGYQYHHQSGLHSILAMVKKKKASGKQVEFAINPVGLCFGVTSGYLALEYAIRELYGDEVPSVDDFTISTKTKMGGVWDMWELYFGKRLSREEAQFGMTPEAYVFTAERPLEGRRLVFTYSTSLAENLTRLGAAKQHPEKFPKGEFQKVKKSLITTLLARRAEDDYGYFEIIENNF